jgi:cytochrome c oxidase assembly protein subunit 15
MDARRLVRPSRALVALTGFLLVFGSTVRVHGAGLSCPDWPLCFGHVVPAYDFHVYLEFGHRCVAGVVSLMFLGQSAALWRGGLLGRSRALRVLVPLSLVALATQVVLGGLTVLKLLAGWTVASHLVTGNTFAALLLLTSLAIADEAGRPERTDVGVVQRVLATLLAVLVPAQLVLGGLVAGHGAGLACSTWPSCNDAGAFPTLSGVIGLQVMHRIGAYTVATVALANLVAHARHPRARRPAIVVVALVALQIALGVANVLLRLPIEITLLHSATAASISLSTAWLLDEVWRAPLAVIRPGTLGRPLEAK